VFNSMIRKLNTVTWCVQFKDT